MTTGKSRYGKTTLNLKLTANDARLLVFDFPARDWPLANCERVLGLKALSARALEVGAGPVRISYGAAELNGKEFGRFCQLALAWSHDAPLTIVAEELADVVNPGKAPGGWGELVRGGMAYGNTVIGITQRPQETDRSIFGNATTLRIFRAQNEPDAAYISKATGIPTEAILSLKKLEYLEKHDDSDALELKTVPV